MAVIACVSNRNESVRTNDYGAGDGAGDGYGYGYGYGYGDGYGDG